MMTGLLSLWTEFRKNERKALERFLFVQFSKLINSLTKTDALLQLCGKRLILFKCFCDIVNICAFITFYVKLKINCTFNVFLLSLKWPFSTHLWIWCGELHLFATFKKYSNSVDNSPADNTLGCSNYSCCSWNSASEGVRDVQSKFTLMAAAP